MKKLVEGRNECTNQEYHSQKDWLSSSSLKKILKDPALFHKEEILGQKEPEKDNPAFAEGSYFHSLVLEPDTIKQTYAFFPGMRKAGLEWEAFKADHVGKTILSKAQKMKVEYWVRAYDANREAKRIMKPGESEVTICRVIDGVPIKVRADRATVEQSYLCDLKTSGFLVDKDSFTMTCRNYGYFLSAALYTMVFEQHFGRPFSFYLIPVSKVESECKVYLISDRTMLAGKLQVKKALELYKHCTATGIWKLPEGGPAVQTEVEEI